MVTGASSGIGRAVCCALAQRRAVLSLVARTADALHDTRRAIASEAAAVHEYRADLTNDKDVAALTDALKADWGRVDILVHSAGLFLRGSVEEQPVADLDRLYRINVRAPYLLTQSLLPIMKGQDGGLGQIVFVNSLAGLHARAGLSQYAATKFALRALADSVRQEVRGEGIRVMSVYPGRVATPMQRAVRRMEGGAYEPASYAQPEDIADVLVNALCLPATAEVTDVSVYPFGGHGAESGGPA
ncbi:MAG: SDR family NAD(P)-dependent oxidoreductase [Candidatus Hydrogenedentes bacterium]|nr:SDR family NAD(P)-dependent oxidoreductase [Candidatus Hydrogenedentota bacterium]